MYRVTKEGGIMQFYLRFYESGNYVNLQFLDMKIGPIDPHTYDMPSICKKSEAHTPQTNGFVPSKQNGKHVITNK